MTDLLWRVVAKFIQSRRERRARHAEPLGTVLMLHSVGAPDDSEFNVSAESFERLLQNLAERHCIRLEDWEKAPKGFFALTFDDVPGNFYTVAYPLLVRYGLPFTIFVNLKCLDEEGYLTLGQLKEIAKCPLCTVGSHGCSHGFYRRLKAPEKITDLRLSRDKLVMMTERNVRLFAFPYGSVYACGLSDISFVRKFYRYGFSTLNAPLTRDADPCFLPRVCVTENYPLCR